VSMLLNWYSVDACFLSSSWHISSRSEFAGSLVGIFFLCMAIEGVRRLGREYDRKLILSTKVSRILLSDIGRILQGSLKGGEKQVVTCESVVSRFTPSWFQQLIRGLCYGSQFTAAFMVMLLGMYFNAAVLIIIFIGQTVGFIVFGRDTCAGAELVEHTSGSCC
ncbi:hypothetical protein TREMEDRAFT_31891, partial [Tremella mesenterica DSM 1558]|uniref:uncharacterized protein n=1 Tax=Tremella mesenterica (strain ATCC 24925 / CBS 8224 / DSM 1558 / NBRC 9311 / NRRL Y-6157 / RJB 2259-6 / UBC 559-6) TaxID=578456 RepID=UPI0003F494F5